jgi:DNA-binding transcriptional MerR regulator
LPPSPTRPPAARQAKAVGIRLDEVARIIDLQRTGHQPCATVIQLLAARLTDIDRQLADLTALRATLAAAQAAAEDAQRAGQAAVICTVIESATPHPGG